MFQFASAKINPKINKPNPGTRIDTLIIGLSPARLNIRHAGYWSSRAITTSSIIKFSNDLPFLD